MNQGIEAAEEELKWWLDIFGKDFYIELNRHGLEEEYHVNQVLIEFSKKYNVKIIAANDVFYINKEDSTAHDILLCIKQGEFKSTPIGRGRGKRNGFKNDEYYFKSHGMPHEYLYWQGKVKAFNFNSSGIGQPIHVTLPLPRTTVLSWFSKHNK